MKKLTLPLLATALWAAASCLHAQTIGVSYSNGSTYATLAAATSAGAPGYTQTNFNNVTATTAATNLNDNSGVATTAAAMLTGSSLGFSYFTRNPSGADEVLNDGFVFNNGANPLTLTLSTIPYASYSLVVYFLDYNANPSSLTLGNTTFDANGPAPFANGYVDGNAATTYTYLQATGTTSTTATTGADYAVFTGLSGATQTLTIQDVLGELHTPTLQAFQIVNTTSVVPEPETWAMLGVGVGVGGLGLVWRQRRRTA